MSSIRFDPPFEAILTFSERPCLLFGVFDNGNLVYALPDGEIRIAQDSVRLGLHFDEKSQEWLYSSGVDIRQEAVP
jgi:hypothetical protein